MMLISSDDISIPVDPAFLAAHSTVFRDLLAVPRTADAADVSACRITETAVDFNLFFDVLHGNRNEVSLEKLRVLVEMADKYDCFTIKAACIGHLWSVRYGFFQPTRGELNLLISFILQAPLCYGRDRSLLPGVSLAEPPTSRSGGYSLFVPSSRVD